jgi:hypothetical protein
MGLCLLSSSDAVLWAMVEMVYWKWVRKGVDRSYVVWMADKAEKRNRARGKLSGIARNSVELSETEYRKLELK